MGLLVFQQSLETNNNDVLKEFQFEIFKENSTKNFSTVSSRLRQSAV
jgi:hypothetical protein